MRRSMIPAFCMQIETPFVLPIVRLLAASTVVLGLAQGAAAQPYSARQEGQIVRLTDAKSQVAVGIVPSIGNVAFEMTVKGQNVLRWPYGSIEDFKAKPGLSGIPKLTVQARDGAGNVSTVSSEEEPK